MAEGHRKRLRDRYLKDGIGSVSETEILELLLFNVMTRKDTRGLAERLMQKFGSIYRIIEAPPEELSGIEGLGESVYTFLHCLKDFIFFYNLGNVRRGKYMGVTSDIGYYIMEKYGGVESEVLLQLCLDDGFRILDEDLLTIGSRSQVRFNVSAIVERACRAKCSYIVIAHNHPSGLAIPSLRDLETTRQLYEGLSSLGIFLLDHIIFEKDDFVSLRDSNLLHRDEPWIGEKQKNE